MLVNRKIKAALLNGEKEKTLTRCKSTMNVTCQLMLFSSRAKSDSTATREAMASGRKIEDDVRLECRLRLDTLMEGNRPERDAKAEQIRILAPDPGGAAAESCSKFSESAGNFVRQILIFSSPSSIRKPSACQSKHSKYRETTLQSTFSLPLVDHSPAKSWVLAGETGRGRSTIVRHIIRSWCGRGPKIDVLQNFQGLIVLGGEKVSDEGFWEPVKEILSDTVERWSAADLAEWMEESRVLIVVDDFMVKYCRDALEETLEEWTEASFLLTTRPEDALAARALLGAHHSTLHLSLPGIDATGLQVLTARYLSQREQVPFQTWVEGKRGIVAETLTYPSLVEPACKAWQTGKWSVSTVTTTELMWGIMECIMARDKRLNVSALTEWMMVLSRMCRESLEQNGLPLMKEDFEKEVKKLFSNDLIQVVFSAFCFSYSPTFPATVTLPHPLTQFLAAWNAIHENMHGTPMKALVKKIWDEDSIVIYAAGHLARLLEYQPDLAEKNVDRAAKNLMLHMDRAKDRFGYTLRIMHECRIHPRVFQPIVKEVEIARYFEIRNNAVLPDAVAALLQHNTPKKIQVTVEKNRMAPDIMDVIEILARNPYPIFLADMNHLEWDHPETTDEIVNALQNGIAPLEDFLGCLNVATIESLPLSDVTRHLVCLRVRVCDVGAMTALLNTPSCLPNLMWLEADFDLSLCEITKEDLTPVPTPLMDVCFKDMVDDDVDYMCNLLSVMRSWYSGVHLTRCSLTPQGVVNIIKTIYSRGMHMTATKEAIKRYRIWRFPALSTIPFGEEMTEAIVQHRLGYDDRHHYSDNEVFSDVVISSGDAKFLESVFVAMEDLVFFRYVCANYIILKKGDGSVQVTKLI